MNRRNFLRTAGYAGLALPPMFEQAMAKICPPSKVNPVGGSQGGAICPPPPMPQYMSGMAGLEVRTLSTTSNGVVTMFDSLPAEWKLLGQPNGADLVFKAWSGGASDSLGMRLFVHGGGHFDSSNNGIYVFDFNGTTAPTGWSVAPNSLSALSAVVQSAATYSDGKPCAIHSYNQLWYDPVLNRLYRVGGSGFGPGGGGITSGSYYSFGSNSWSPLITDGNIGSSLGSTLVGAPDGSKVLFLSSTHIPMFITSNGSGTQFGDAITGSEVTELVAAMDTSRSNTATGVCRYVLFGHDPNGPRAKVVTVNWPANTFTITVQTLTGTNAGDLESGGPCVLYDDQTDSFWVFANDDDASDGQISSIYQVNANTFAVTKFALSSSIQGYTSAKGGFNRHVWFPGWRIIGTVHAHDQPVSLIKLP